MTDGVYLAPIDLDDLGFPDEEIPFLRNDVQFADFFNLMIECINALRLCGSVTVPTPQGEQDPSGMYPRPLTRTEVNFPTDPLPYFGNHTQQGRIRNFFVDALNALRRCYLSASPTAQGTSIDAAVYLPPPTIASIGFPDADIPTNLFGNHVQGKRLYDYLVDALNRLRNCCVVGCDVDGTSTAAPATLSATKLLGDDFTAWAVGTGAGAYADFLEDTCDNPNYEAGIIRPGGPYTDNPLPANLPGFFWEHFDDVNAAFPYTPPVGTVNRNRISQNDVDGGHRSLKAIKLADDYVDLFHGYEIWPMDTVSGSPNNRAKIDSLWTRLRCQFSSNFPLGQTDVKYTYPVGTKGMYFINCERHQSDAALGRNFQAVIATGTGAGGFNADTLTIEHRATPNAGTTVFRASLGAVADVIATGSPIEIVMYCGTSFDAFNVPVANEYRVAAWIGPAFGALTKVYDVRKPTTIGFGIGEINMLRAKNHYYVPTGDAAICYECISWELEDGDGNGAGTFDPYAVDV